MTTHRVTETLHYGPDDAKWSTDVMGIQVRMLAGGEDTGGGLTVFEYTAPPGFPGPALHVHRSEDEGMFVLEGSLTVQAGDRRDELGPGGFVWHPRGIPHGFCNASDEPARFLGLVVPGNLEAMLVELAERFSGAATLNPATLIEINRKHGLEVVGPPILNTPEP